MNYNRLVHNSHGLLKDVVFFLSQFFPSTIAITNEYIFGGHFSIFQYLWNPYVSDKFDWLTSVTNELHLYHTRVLVMYLQHRVVRHTQLLKGQGQSRLLKGQPDQLSYSRLRRL